jgi:hypothetical protein
MLLLSSCLVVNHIAPWRCFPAPTCMMTLPPASLLQDARSAQGYWDSVIRENDEHNNETFTYRLKLLKRNVRQAVRCRWCMSKIKRGADRCTALH